MKRLPAIETLFVDIGGVLLTNGWDHRARRRAAREYRLEWAGFEGRHRAVFELHERGLLTLDEYLDLVVFDRTRSFTPAEFRAFMFAQSHGFPEMISLVRRLKARYALKVVAVSNEARELNAHRIRAFALDSFVDAFISSCFVHERKPDAAMFTLALDISQADARSVLFIDDTPMFTRVAEGLGIRSVLHTDLATTRRHLAAAGLSDAKGAS
jgi:putative hydrolase of the HAD superfamily